MTPKKKERGMSIVLPKWWLDEVRRLATKQAGWTQERLAEALTKVAGRPVKWDHKTVGNFLKGEHATIEMMEAFCALFDGLPPCQFRARTVEEAIQMRIASRRFDSPSDKESFTAMLDRALEEHEKIARDQMARLDSRDEVRVESGRRGGSLGRGRASTPRS